MVAESTTAMPLKWPPGVTSSVRLSISAASSDPSTTSRSQEVISPLSFISRPTTSLPASCKVWLPLGCCAAGRGAGFETTGSPAPPARTELPAADRGAGLLGDGDALIDGAGAGATGGAGDAAAAGAADGAGAGLGASLDGETVGRGVASRGSPAGATCGAAGAAGATGGTGAAPLSSFLVFENMGRGTSEIQNTANRQSPIRVRICVLLRANAPESKLYPQVSRIMKRIRTIFGHSRSLRKPQR